MHTAAQGCPRPGLPPPPPPPLHRLDTPPSPLPPQHTKADYAAELRAQIAAKEAARQAEREHSLRQSAAHLAVRQAAPSAVLPMPARLAAPLQPAVDAHSGAGTATRAITQQPASSLQKHGEQPAAPWSVMAAHAPALPTAARQYGWEDEAPGGWQAAAQYSMPPSAPTATGRQWWHAAEQLGGHCAAMPSEPRFVGSLPGGLLGGWPATYHPGWQEPQPAALRGWMDDAAPAPYPPVRQPPLQQAAQLLRPAMPPLQPSPTFLPSDQAAGTSEPPLPPNHGAVVSRAPFGNDLQPPQPPPARSRSLRLPPGAAAGPGMPPWGVFRPGAAPAHAVGSPARAAAAAAGRLAAFGAEQVEGQAARQAQVARRAAYKAELEAQMAAKEERRRQVGSSTAGTWSPRRLGGAGKWAGRNAGALGTARRVVQHGMS